MPRCRWLLIAIAACSLLAGCDTDLPRATEVVSMRVLGARLEVVGDETRTTPRPGEQLSVTLATVFPEVDRHLEDAQSLFIGCTAPDRFTGGVPICQEIIDAVVADEDVADALPMVEGERLRCSDLQPPRRAQEGAVSLACISDEPSVVLDVPESFAADELLLLGVICERGDPFIEPLDPLLFGCADLGGGELVRVQGIFTVRQRESDENHNPDLDALSVLREGQPWAPAPADLPPEENCEGSVTGDDPALHRVVPGEHRITLRYRPDAREENEGEPENLELTVYTTLGEMERRFTLFEGDEMPDEETGLLQDELNWEPPLILDPDPDDRDVIGSKLVRFFITLRDQRGGFAITERALCLR